MERLDIPTVTSTPALSSSTAAGRVTKPEPRSSTFLLQPVSTSSLAQVNDAVEKKAYFALLLEAIFVICLRLCSTKVIDSLYRTSTAVRRSMAVIRNSHHDGHKFANRQRRFRSQDFRLNVDDTKSDTIVQCITRFLPPTPRTLGKRGLQRSLGCFGSSLTFCVLSIGHLSKHAKPRRSSHCPLRAGA